MTDKAISISDRADNMSSRKEKVEAILIELSANKIDIGSMRKLSEHIAARITEGGDKCTGSTFRRKGSVYKPMLEKFMGIEPQEVSGSSGRNALSDAKRDIEIRRLNKKIIDLEGEIEALHLELLDMNTLKIDQHAAPDAKIYTSTELDLVKDELSRAYELVTELFREATSYSINANEGTVYETLDNKVIMTKHDFPTFFNIYTKDMKF